MKRKIVLVIFSIAPCLSFAQEFSGELTSEWQWDMNKRTNWVNLLRLNMRLPLANGKGAFEAATLHVAKTKEETILADWQGFSNIEADNMFAAIAVLGYMHTWRNAHLFVGVRNVNEDFFTSALHQQFVRHLPHHCRQLPHSQLSVLGPDPLF